MARTAKRGERNKDSWSPGRARLCSLARNDEGEDDVIPAKAGIQEAKHESRYFVSEQLAEGLRVTEPRGLGMTCREEIHHADTLWRRCRHTDRPHCDR